MFLCPRGRAVQGASGKVPAFASAPETKGLVFQYVCAMDLGFYSQVPADSPRMVAWNNYYATGKPTDILGITPRSWTFTSRYDEFCGLTGNGTFRLQATTGGSEWSYSPFPEHKRPQGDIEINYVAGSATVPFAAGSSEEYLTWFGKQFTSANPDYSAHALRATNPQGINAVGTYFRQRIVSVKPSVGTDDVIEQADWGKPVALASNDKLVIFKWMTEAQTPQFSLAGGKPSWGTVKIDPKTGAATVTPKAGFSGEETLKCTITDRLTGGSTTASVTVRGPKIPVEPTPTPTTSSADTTTSVAPTSEDAPTGYETSSAASTDVPSSSKSATQGGAPTDEAPSGSSTSQALAATGASDGVAMGAVGALAATALGGIAVFASRRPRGH